VLCLPLAWNIDAEVIVLVFFVTQVTVWKEQKQLSSGMTVPPLILTIFNPHNLWLRKQYQTLVE